jgi:hypothetical protein
MFANSEWIESTFQRRECCKVTVQYLLGLSTSFGDPDPEPLGFEIICLTAKYRIRIYLWIQNNCENYYLWLYDLTSCTNHAFVNFLISYEPEMLKTSLLRPCRHS